MKKLLLGLLFAGLLITLLVLVRALQHTPETTEVTPLVEVSLDEQVIAERLAEAIRFRTVSHQQPEDFEAGQFTGFIDWIKANYPEVVPVYS